MSKRQTLCRKGHAQGPVRRALNPLPRVWLISDARNDARLEKAIKRLPPGSGVIFRHYHLDIAARRARFHQIARCARAMGHRVILSGTVRQARAWGADGAYGPALELARGPATLRLVTAHGLRDLGRVQRADAGLLSPVFATRSHPGGKALGPVRFRLLAAQSRRPVIALGGLDAARARRLLVWSWAAIDGLSR